MAANRRNVLSRSLMLAAATLAVACSSLPALPQGSELPAALGWQHLAEGIDYVSFSLGRPKAEVHALRVDLDSVEVVATPAGSSFGQVIGRSVIEFAREFDCIAAINATPFYPDSFRRGGARYLSGILLLDGEQYSAPAAHFSALVIDRSGKASIARQASLGDASSLRLAIGGFFPLIAEGRVVARKTARKPMTVVGVLAGGHGLLCLVMDGRRPGSAGMSEEEAGRLLLSMGAIEGMSFDGGSSSAMAIQGPDGRTRMVNLPIHLAFPPMERIVGTCIGFRNRGPR